MSEGSAPIDVAIIGAGAAGLATAIAVGRANPALRVEVLDGARQPGAKILVSGGGRCNVTNVEVSEADFNGGPKPLIRRVLRQWPVARTVAFFAELGVPLHEEPNGKLFPDTNRARDVLQALLDETRRVGVTMRSGVRVNDITVSSGGFDIHTADALRRAGAVVLATGGLSLPKTGSDGWGIDLARRLGHAVVPTTPALAPLTLASDAHAMHAALSGVSMPVRLEQRAGEAVVRVDGALLWTHFGISGPAALDLSRHWHRAAMDRVASTVTASLLPGESFEGLEATWTDATRWRPRTPVATVLGDTLPASVADAIASRLGLADRALSHLTRDDRRRLLHHLVAWPLGVTGSRGYNYAEATAGGVSLREVDMATMESRQIPGLYFTGEILDVDGRLGGFNFQWAWASAHVAGQALARRASSAHHGRNDRHVD